MGRKRGRKNGQNGGQGTVTEATRIDIAKRLEDFRASDAEEYTFEPGLSKFDRAAVHELCKKMGLISRSKGGENNRRLSVFKNKKNPSQSKGEEMGFLEFSEQTKLLLQDLFTRYPPVENLSKETVVRADNRSNNSRGRDDAFAKPQYKEEDIAKRLNAVDAKLETTPYLKKLMEERSRLPIAAFRDAIISTVENNQVVLISGETGCGKTTQVPQYLMESMWRKGQSCKIVCTQPRRLSAMSVAERISYERGENVGDNVGYKIRLQSQGGKQSSIMFCTNGILLRMLIGDGENFGVSNLGANQSKAKNLGITHIIVDEIHERDRFSDFMLAIIRDLLPLRPHLRLILMSATLESERFSGYFGGCPIIQVPGFTYPVKSFYLEDVLSILHYSCDNHLNSCLLNGTEEETVLDEEYWSSLEESLDLALFSDEFEPLLELVALSRKSAVVNYQHSTTGVSPLMVFAAGGRVSDVYMLLSLGVDCSLRSKDGRTALDWAQQNNHDEVCQIIREYVLKKSQSSEADGEGLLAKYLSQANPDLIDTHLIVRLIQKICMDSVDGAILVFLPGWDDINKTREALLACPKFKDASKYLILSLHSMIPPAEQKNVFQRPPPGARKIVLSTNIAETAITIDDVVFVIDSGRMKERSYDPYNNVSTLFSSWVSKASMRQREGRAGRCKPGICYHLFSTTRAASFLDYQVPEIKRMPIDEVCLQVKLLDPDSNIADFLQRIMDPPVMEAISNGILVLKDTGMLTHDERLTELGEKLGTLPVHPLVGKMLLIAVLMNCLDPALTLACAIDYRDPFILPMDPRQKKLADAAKATIALFYGRYSDHLITIATFDLWQRAKDLGLESKFCSMFFVSGSTMKMIQRMRQQLTNELVKNGFLPHNDISAFSMNSQDSGILRAVLAAGAYPMVGKLLPRIQGATRSAVETVNGTKVFLHPHSSNFKLTVSKSAGGRLFYLFFDEITRGDGRMFIKNCTVLSPYPLLLLATEMAVASVDDDGDSEDEKNMEISASEVEGGDVEMSVKMSKEEKIMSSPEKSVAVVLDRWLLFMSTAIDVAQIYCLRERLAAAVLFKVKHPREPLPPELAASMQAIACVLSWEASAGMPMDKPTSMTNAEPPAGGQRKDPVMAAFLTAIISDSNRIAGKGVPKGMLKSAKKAAKKDAMGGETSRRLRRSARMKSG